MMTNAKRLFGLILVIPLLYACSSTPDDKLDKLDTTTSTPVQASGVIYISEQHETLRAIYHDDATSVEVHLPDGRITRLPVVNSLSGTRYSDGRETFWAYRDKGMYWLVNQRIFDGELVR